MPLLCTCIPMVIPFVQLFPVFQGPVFPSLTFLSEIYFEVFLDLVLLRQTSMISFRLVSFGLARDISPSMSSLELWEDERFALSRGLKLAVLSVPILPGVRREFGHVMMPL